MESYLEFADVYDELMDQVPYADWRDRITDAIDKYGISKRIDRNAEEAFTEPSEEELLASERNLVVDLGCGTGILTEMLYKEGFDMIGVDNSESMLEKAIEKRDASGSEILYLNQDMQELELYSTVGTVICICDSLNYLIEDADLEQTFALVHNYLYPGGLFIFDFNTVYKYRDVIGEDTIAENREDCSFIWENYYDEETRINEYDLTLFIKKDKDIFRKVTETHFQKGFRPEEIKKLLTDNRFEIISFLDSDTMSEITDETQRCFAVVRCIKG